VPSPNGAETRFAPVFLLVDDDRGAIELIQKMLHVDWYYIPLWEPRLVARYAERFLPAAIFLAEPIGYPDGGAARLLQDLLDRVGVPVVILTEMWTPEAAERWKRMGAADCIPHPTRFVERIEGLRLKMEEFALRRRSEAGSPASSPGRPSATSTSFEG